MNRRLLCLCSALLLCSCHVKNRQYNMAPSSLVVLPPAASPPPTTTVGNCDPAKSGCLAFIEFDDMGEYWQGHEPGQLTNAIKLIQIAKKESQTPIIITFVHGWKNNAALKNDNVHGFEGVLQFIRDMYHLPVVGIYIGWRGDLISKYWPIRRQLSYFNREGAAIRIPGASMTEAFTRIMIEGHKDSPGARVIMVGHSFGGLVLERALTQALTDFVIRSGGNLAAHRDEDAREARTWADLVVFVNSAAAASEGKQMLNLLKDSIASYTTRTTRAQDLLHRGQERPLLVSVSSIGDAATRFALPIGHGPSYLNRVANGSWRTYTSPEPPGVPSESSFYLSTTAHMQALQSHDIVEVRSTVHPTLPATCPAPFSDPFPVTSGEHYQVCEKPGRWNTTPYFAMEMPVTIVPDHGGIFNENFVTLLLQFLPSVTEMRTPGLAPQLRSTPRIPAAP